MEKEREKEPDSTFLDPARSIFFPLSTVNLSWGDRLARPASSPHVDLEKKLYHGVYIRSILAISGGREGGNAKGSC